MTTGESEWRFPLATQAADVHAPRCDDTAVPPEKRVSAHWRDDGAVLEYRTGESREAYLRTDTPVLSLQNYR